MDDEYYKALLKAFERDEKQAVSLGRVDTAYGLGFNAAWNTRKSPQPNDADVVEKIAKAIEKANLDHRKTEGLDKIHDEIKSRNLAMANACLKALSDNGYKIVKEG